MKPRRIQDILQAAPATGITTDEIVEARWGHLPDGGPLFAGAIVSQQVRKMRAKGHVIRVVRVYQYVRPPRRI